MTGSSRSSVLGLLLVGAVLGGLGAWWLFSAPETRSLPRESPQDDLQMLAALTDGATAASPADILVAGPGRTILARASDRTVLTYPEDGGAPVVLARLSAPARAMALVGEVLWVASRDQILKLPLAGSGGGEPAVLPCHLAGPRALDADARRVFVVDVAPGASGLTRASTIVRVDAATGATTVLGRSSGEVTNVAIDADHVYWADRLEGSIVAAPIDGGPLRALATDRGLPGSIAIGGDGLVWVEKRSESLWTMARTGGAPRQLVQDFAGFTDVVVDAHNVYWATEDAVDGFFRVLQVPIGGGQAMPLSPGVASIDALATDGVRLVWEHAGRVETLARP